MLSDDFKSRIVNIIKESIAEDYSYLITEIADKMNLSRMFTSEETIYIYDLVTKWCQEEDKDED